MQPLQRDVDAMRLALDAARPGAAAGDVPIGAVVIGPGGDVIASAGNRRERDSDPTAHAEVLVLRAAAAAIGSWRLDGHILAVTLEPCAMCAGAASLSRVNRLVFGAFNPDYGAVGSVWDVLREPRRGHEVEVVSGVLAADCSALLADYFRDRR